jgi:hypothetical protein
MAHSPPRTHYQQAYGQGMDSVKWAPKLPPPPPSPLQHAPPTLPTYALHPTSLSSSVTHNHSHPPLPLGQPRQLPQPHPPVTDAEGGREDERMKDGLDGGVKHQTCRPGKEAGEAGRVQCVQGGQAGRQRGLNSRHSCTGRSAALMGNRGKGPLQAWKQGPWAYAMRHPHRSQRHMPAPIHTEAKGTCPPACLPVCQPALTHLCQLRTQSHHKAACPGPEGGRCRTPPVPCVSPATAARQRRCRRRLCPG